MMTVSTQLKTFLAAGLACSLWLPNTAVAQEQRIRIGLLASLSGPLAAGGEQMKQGLDLCLHEREFTLAGRKVDVVVGDTAGQPAVARNKTQELVEREKVHVLFGPVAAFEALAIDDYVRQAEIPI